MSALPPPVGRGWEPDPDHPGLQERPLSRAERRGRWEIRAAQWRARELAELVFGRVCQSSLIGMRGVGPMRGLLTLDVPFVDLPTYRRCEARFLAAAACDPVLSRVPLVYILGPHAS